MSKNEVLPDLQYYLFRGSHTTLEYFNIYHDSYQMWKTVWKEAFTEVKGNSFFFSDQFTRQHSIGSLFYKNQCIMLSFFRPVNFNFESVNDDSYFDVWPEEAIDELCKYGKSILVGSYITVHKDFRGNSFPYSLKKLAFDFSVCYMEDCGADALCGTMRSLRGMTAPATECGSIILKEKIKYHREIVDLVVCYSSKHRKSSLDIQHHFVKSLWNKKINCEEVTHLRKVI